MQKTHARPTDAVRERVRERIISAASALLAEGGQGAFSTRAICEAAAIKPPTMYRLFVDKQDLLDAVIVRSFNDHQDSHRALESTGDPVQDLRRGWDLHLEFGLANPHLYSLMFGQPRSGASSTSVVLANDVLEGHIRRIAEAGRLRVSERHATYVMNAAGCGATLTLIAMPEDARDRALSISMREAAIDTITTGASAPPVSGLIRSAIALRAVSAQATVLRPTELALLQEWLDAIAADSQPELLKPHREL